MGKGDKWRKNFNFTKYRNNFDEIQWKVKKSSIKNDENKIKESK
jgi:hypothetical protein